MNEILDGMNLEDYCSFNNVVIVYKSFTYKVKGFCFLHGEHQCIVLNKKHCNSGLITTLVHELIHIEANHLYREELDIVKCEEEVEKYFQIEE